MTPRTPRLHTARNRRLAGILVAGAALAAAAPAIAIPPPPPPPPPNLPPVATLAATPNPVLVPRPIVVAPGGVGQAAALLLGPAVTFDASGSRDPDGSIVKYEWDLDGAAGYESTTTAPTTTRRHRDNGDITARVRVTDNRGATASRATVLRRHFAPVARATASTDVAVVGAGITFDGSTSTDDRGITKHEWDLDGNGTFERTGVQANTSFGTVGVHTATLRVTDTFGVTRTATAGVRVHRAPTAIIVTRPQTPVVNNPVTLDGSRSTDDGTIARYEWDLDGDGTYETDTAAAPTATTTFTATGPARVGLRVTDGDGATDRTMLQLQVEPTPAAADTTAPSMRPLAKRLTMTRSGRISLRVLCPTTEQMCTVRVRLRGVIRPLRGRTIGAAGRAMASGRRAVVTMRATPRAQRAIRRAATTRAMAVITATDAAGNRAVTRTAVRIRR